MRASGWSGVTSGSWRAFWKRERAGAIRAILTASSVLGVVLVGATPSGAETPGSISGTVTIAGGRAVVGGWVYVRNADGSYYQYDVVSQYDANPGAYEFTNVPAGTYFIEFTEFPGASDQWYDGTSSFGSATAVVVNAGAATTVDVQLAATVPGSISGTVTASGGAPASGGCVEARLFDGSSDNNTVWATYTTCAIDEAGDYSFDALPAGRYLLRFTDFSGLVGSGSLGWVTWSAGVNSVDLGAGDAATLNVVLEIAGVISGRITLPDGSPANGAYVYADCIEQFLGFYGDATTDADGNYSIGNLGECFHPYAVYVSASGFSDQSFSADVVSGETTVADYQLTAPVVLTDIAGNPFEADIQWMADSGISTGYADGTFRPGANVSRQAMAAFMYRFAGAPAYTPPVTSPFNDVATDSSFYAEICWMADQGISTGYPDGGFHPTANVSRQAMAAFMYRFAGSPAFTPPVTSPFNDVATSSTFYLEVTWMADAAISTGYPDGGFHPAANVSRQAMSAFVHRLDGVLVG